MNKPKILLITVLIITAFLRLWKISEVPVSLFGDELDVGYHAYSILKTGRDYSGNFMPIHFKSLAEWRTPLYLYSAVPTVALFGISQQFFNFVGAKSFFAKFIVKVFTQFSDAPIVFKFPVS